MATAILYTTIEAIRASVGLDEADVPNELILNQNLKMQFILDLDTWYPSIYEDDWIDSGFDPLSEGDASIVSIDALERKGYLLSAYSMWFGAYRLIETMLAVPQKISDGKDEVQRFNGINLEKILGRVRDNLVSVKTVIVNESANTTTAVLGMSVAVSESYDPVTGS